jgi:hypothetical protein
VVKKSGFLVTALAVAVFFAMSAWAQDQSSGNSQDQSSTSSSSGQNTGQAGEMGTTGTHHHRHHGAASNGTVTRVGCLQKNGDTYTLTTMKGQTINLDTSNMGASNTAGASSGSTAGGGGAMDLSAHVGHKVRVRGTMSGAGGTAASAGSSGGGETLMVTSLKHLSKTCNAGGGSMGTSGAGNPK